MARANNSPTNWKGNVEIVENNNILHIFNEFRKMPPVRKFDVAEIKERLDKYFDICEENRFIPTVESMMLCLGISRQAAWKWQKEECEAGQIVERAKQFINAIISSAAMMGQTPFPYAIWLQKNHFGYSDSQKLEIEGVYDSRKALSAADLPKLSDLKDKIQRFVADNNKSVMQSEAKEQGENGD